MDLVAYRPPDAVDAVFAHYAGLCGTPSAAMRAFCTEIHAFWSAVLHYRHAKKTGCLAVDDLLEARDLKFGRPRTGRLPRPPKSARAPPPPGPDRPSGAAATAPTTPGRSAAPGTAATGPSPAPKTAPKRAPAGADGAEAAVLKGNANACFGRQEFAQVRPCPAGGTRA